MKRSLRWLLLLAAAGATFAYFRWVRVYPWSLAIIMGTAVGALVWAVARTTDRLRALRRPPPDSD